MWQNRRQVTVKAAPKRYPLPICCWGCPHETPPGNGPKAKSKIESSRFRGSFPVCGIPVVSGKRRKARKEYAPRNIAKSNKNTGNSLEFPVFLVETAGLEPVTSCVWSGFLCFPKSKNPAFSRVSAVFNDRYDTDRQRSVSYFCRTFPGLFFFPHRIVCSRTFAMQGELSLLLQALQKLVSLGGGDVQQRNDICSPDLFLLSG